MSAVPTGDATPLLSVRELSVTYRSLRGPVRAVSDVHFELYPDEVIALIGESGSGKSTLGQTLVRLIPDGVASTTGSVTFFGERGPEDILTLGPNQLRRFRWGDCAYVSQSAISAFNPLLRIATHFQETGQAHGKSNGRRLKETAFDLLASMHLEPARVWNAYPHELSGGMRQRALLALAMLLEPKILILDEPTTALDVLTQRAIIDVLTDLHHRKNMAIVFISHDLGVACELADRIFTLYAGRIVEVGTTEQTVRATAHPYTASLLRALPTLEATREIVSIPGAPPDLVTLPPGCAFHPRCSHARPRCSEGDGPPLASLGHDHASACHFASEVQATTLRERVNHV